MKYFFVTILFCGIIFAGGNNWRIELSVASGRTQKLTIGMDTVATDGFDRGIDIPSPPVSMAPPTGFYPFIKFEDPNYTYIPAAWADIRAVSEKAKWKIILHGVEEPVTASWTGIELPAGYLTINGIDFNSLAGKFVVPANDTILEIDYCEKRPKMPEEHTTAIKFKLDKPAHIKVVIKDKNGIHVETLDYGTVVAGEHHRNWHPVEASPGIFLYEIYADDEITAYGKLVILGH